MFRGTSWLNGPWCLELFAMLNIPNMLTIFRIFLIPVLVLAYFWDMPDREIIVTGIFVLAAITDWLDGFLARKLGAITRLGAFLTRSRQFETPAGQIMVPHTATMR